MQIRVFESTGGAAAAADSTAIRDVDAALF